jgi:excinuclease ABC subunit C
MAEANPKYAQSLTETIARLPHKPGVYQYFDEAGKIIYVGKAKGLKSRVSSYFNNDTQHGAKITYLVKQIAKIEVVVVETEIDALLLENNLIKTYQPRYNVLMKDDKTYPWICIKKEEFPRIFYTRQVIKDGSSYFGPYASGKMMHTILDLIRQLYPLRTCKLQLTQSNIAAHKFKVCLEHHIGKCNAPCVGKESEAEYQQYITDVKELLKGNIHTVKTSIRNQMMHFAQTMEFEKAQILKEKMELLERYQSKSIVVSTYLKDADVFSIINEPKEAFVNYLKVVNGAVVQAHSVEIKKKLDETDEDLLIHAIIDIRERFFSYSKEIIVPIELDIALPNTVFTVPQRGDKKQLLELSERNLKFFRLDLRKQQELVDPERRSNRILAQMQKDLRMKQPPNHIECFDNSNFQGDHAVAACVVFKNAKPSKKDYRHFNIKSVEGANDFASMEEIITRRYSRLLEEGADLPQLIIIDGGKGQLSAAMKSIESLGLKGKITVIGIAKKLEEIYYPGDSIPLYLDKTSESLKIIQQARDEAHRFGITHYRGKHRKSLIKSQLIDINGFGDNTVERLLKKFKSVTALQLAGFEAWKEEVGNAKALLLLQYFENTAKTKEPIQINSEKAN